MIITEHLGNSPRIKILQFLIQNKNNSYSIRDILFGAKVKHRNLIEVLKDLLDKDMIYIEKKVGKSNLYQINEFEPFVQSLIFASEQKN